MKASQLSPIKLPSLELVQEEAPTRAYTSHYGAHPDINFLLSLLDFISFFLFSPALSFTFRPKTAKAAIKHTNSKHMGANSSLSNNTLRKFGVAGGETLGERSVRVCVCVVFVATADGVLNCLKVNMYLQGIGQVL